MYILNEREHPCRKWNKNHVMTSLWRKIVHFGIKQIFDRWGRFLGNQFDQDGNDHPDFTRFRKGFLGLIFRDFRLEICLENNLDNFWGARKIFFDQKRTFNPQIRDNFSKHGPFFQKVAILRFGLLKKVVIFEKMDILEIKRA